MRRRLVIVLFLVPALALLTACGGDDDGPEATPTPDSIRNVVFERAASECGSFPLPTLAERYHTTKERQVVAIAVGRYWAERFQGGEDAADDGRVGCLESFELGPPRPSRAPPIKVPVPTKPKPPPPSP